MKKNKKTLIDCLSIGNLFWTLLSIAPLVVYCLYFINHDLMSMENFLSTTFGITSDSVLVKCFDSIFGVLGIFKTDTDSGLFNTSAFSMVACYYVYVKLIHICVDIITFIPDVTKACINRISLKGDKDYEEG